MDSPRTYGKYGVVEMPEPYCGLIIINAMVFHKGQNCDVCHDIMNNLRIMSRSNTHWR